MEHKTPILITQVGNGFMVELPRSYNPTSVDAADILVFNEMDHLKQWLNEHFEVAVPKRFFESVTYHSMACQVCGEIDGHSTTCKALDNPGPRVIASSD